MWILIKSAILAALITTSAAGFEGFDAIPGGITGVTLDAESKSPIVATFGDTRLPVIQSGDDWMALVPLAWDTVPGFYIVSTLDAEKQYKSYRFPVKAGRRPMYPVTLPEPADPAMLPAPLDLDQELSKVDGEVTSPDLKLVLPVDAPVQYQFGTLLLEQLDRLHPYTGIRFDLSAPDTEVLAPVFGQVVMIETQGNNKFAVVLDHGNGLVSVFRELSAINVRAEDWLAKGAVFGRLSSESSASLEPHWSLRMNGVWVDPMLLVSRKVDLTPEPDNQSATD